MLYLLIIVFILIAVLLYLYIKKYAKNRSLIGKCLIALGVVLFTAAVIIYPEESFKSALDGLTTWFNIVFPSLLPFLIGSELLVSLGVVSFIGALLEGIMRPVFKVPGCGSFPFVMSITSGYPIGSKIVAQLYTNKMCSKVEAQRLLSFCSTSGPLFMIGAVGIGMLGLKNSGLVIAASHYLGALTVGFLFRFYGRSRKDKSSTNPVGLKAAIYNLKESFNKEKRPLGLLLSDAVKNSVNTLLNIGGFIVLFSVVIRLMNKVNIISLISQVMQFVLGPLNIDKLLSGPISSGLIEMTIGSKLIASIQSPMYERVIAISGIIAWSGLSIHAQVASMIGGTDLKMITYIVSKALHSVISSVYAFLIITFVGIPVTLDMNQAVFLTENKGWTANLSSSFVNFLYTVLIFILIVLITKGILKFLSAVNR